MKRKNPLWLWIILALVLAGIIYFIMTSRDIDSEQDIVPMERDTILGPGSGQGYNSMETDSLYSTPQEELY